MKGKTKVLYILIAFVASVLLWVYVVGVERPQKEETISGIPVTFVGEDVIYEDFDLVITSERRPTVNLTVMGSITDIAALNTNKESIKVEADIRNINSAGQKFVNYTVTLPNEDVVLLEQSPYSLSVQFGKVQTVAVPVNLKNSGSVAEDYIAKTPIIEPASLQITGPADVVEQIETAEVTWTRQNVDQTLTVDLDYILLDGEGKEIPTDDLSANHEVVSVTIPVQKTKTVPLVVEFKDGGGATSKNAAATIDPPTIEIAGEPSVVDGLNSINVGTIDLAEVVGSWNADYDIPLPNGVESISGESRCNVSVQMSGLKIETIVCDNVTAIHPPEGYVAELITRERSVTLRGPAEDMDRLEATDVRIVVDLAEQGITEPGKHTVPATVYVDGFTTISELYQVNIAVEILPEE